jgi:hypothetical protein
MSAVEIALKCQPAKQLLADKTQDFISFLINEISGICKVFLTDSSCFFLQKNQLSTSVTKSVGNQECAHRLNCLRATF